MGIVIHTTERQTFKYCEQKWHYSSPNAQNLEPIKPTPALEFGTGIHAALAAYYDPSTPRDKAQALAAWGIYSADAIRLYQRMQDMRINGVPVIEENDITELQERVELGAAMISHYVDAFAPMQDENLECVWVEKPYKVRIKPRSPYVYGFKPDALFRDLEGKYWLGEWKTAASITEVDEWLELDDQSGSYDWGMFKAEGIEIAGVLHTTLAKVAPKPLRILKDGSPSADKSQMTTFTIAYNTLSQHFGGHIPEKYYEMLTKLRSEGTDRFFKRTLVRRNAKARVMMQRSIENETKRMVALRRDPSLLTRSPNRMCGSCQFRDPCIEKWNGNPHGEQFLLENAYQKRGTK